jgi:hypothetical protein
LIKLIKRSSRLKDRDSLVPKSCTVRSGFQGKILEEADRTSREISGRKKADPNPQPEQSQEQIDYEKDIRRIE